MVVTICEELGTIMVQNERRCVMALKQVDYKIESDKPGSKQVFNWSGAPCGEESGGASMVEYLIASAFEAGWEFDLDTGKWYGPNEFGVQAEFGDEENYDPTKMRTAMRNAENAGQLMSGQNLPPLLPGFSPILVPPPGSSAQSLPTNDVGSLTRSSPT